MIVNVTADWSAPLELAQRSLVQVIEGGPVYLALAAPTSPSDGAVMEDRNVTRFDAGTVLRFRAKGASNARVYIGPVG